MKLPLIDWPVTTLRLVLLAVMVVSGMRLMESLREDGRNDVRASWNAEKATQQELARELEHQARLVEQQRALEAQKVEREHAQDLAHAAASAGAARTELDRLRASIAQLDARPVPGGAAGPAAVGVCHAEQEGAAGAGGGAELPEASDATPGADGATALRLLGECAARYAGVAADADKLAAQVRALQGLIRANADSLNR